VTAGAPHRPVLSEVQGVSGFTNETSFSRWGEKVQLAAPARSVPASDFSSGSTTLT
jgi:hypothetical protein